MGRNRKPKALAELDGTFETHPERRANYANEPRPGGALGLPPERWFPHPRAHDARALFDAGADAYAVAAQLGMSWEEAKGLRPGAPPSEPAELLAIWNEIVDQAPPGVLTSSDRLHVELTCRLIRKIRNGTAKTGDYSRVKEFLGKMAMNPADRPKVQVNAGVAPTAPAKHDPQRETNTFAQLAEEGRRQARPN